MDTPSKSPSFKAVWGRAPVAGQDFDPNKPLCQDDYEFYTGTGRYTDDVAPVPAPELVFVPVARFDNTWRGMDNRVWWKVEGAARRFAFRNIMHWSEWDDHRAHPNEGPWVAIVQRYLRAIGPFNSPVYRRLVKIWHRALRLAYGDARVQEIYCCEDGWFIGYWEVSK